MAKPRCGYCNTTVGVVRVRGQTASGARRWFWRCPVHVVEIVDRPQWNRLNDGAWVLGGQVLDCIRCPACGDKGIHSEAAPCLEGFEPLSGTGACECTGKIAPKPEVA